MDVKSGDLLVVLLAFWVSRPVTELVTLRKRFVELGEDPATLAAIDQEIQRRSVLGVGGGRRVGDRTVYFVVGQACLLRDPGSVGELSVRHS